MASFRGPTVTVLTALAGVFLAQQVLVLAGGDVRLLAFSLPITERPWTVVTSVYAHSSLAHLLTNALALAVLGLGIERVTTPLRFHGFFFLTGAFAALVQVYSVVLLGGPQRVAVLGASGAVFALFGYALSGNALAVGLGDHLPRWLNLLVGVLVAAAITLATAAPRVALLAHFTGLFTGLLAGRYRLLHVG